LLDKVDEVVSCFEAAVAQIDNCGEESFARLQPTISLQIGRLNTLA